MTHEGVGMEDFFECTDNCKMNCLVECIGDENNKRKYGDSVDIVCLGLCTSYCDKLCEKLLEVQQAKCSMRV